MAPTPTLYHWKAGVGAPLAAAERVRVSPSFTVWFVGWVLIDGAEAEVKLTVALALVELP